MKLAEKNANKMPAAVNVDAVTFVSLSFAAARCGVISPRKALVHGALQADKNIRKRKLEAPPRSVNLPGNLSRGSCTRPGRVMTQVPSTKVLCERDILTPRPPFLENKRLLDDQMKF